MRNYNHKNHPKPLVHNSYRKSDRTYPQSTKLIKKTVQKTDIKTRTKNVPINSSSRMLVIPNHNKANSQRYFLNLQNPFDMFDRQSTNSYTDQYCLWFKNFDKEPLKQKRTIKVKKVNYTINDWAQDSYPSIIFVCIDGIWGYLDENHIPTKRVTALALASQTTQVRNGVDTTDLIYESKCDQQWQIPESLTQIYVYLTDQNDMKIALPLPNPINLEVEINTVQIN